MAKRTIEVVDIFDLVQRDGLWETIQEITPGKIKDIDLADKIEEVQALVEEIEAYIEDHRDGLDLPASADDEIEEDEF